MNGRGCKLKGDNYERKIAKKLKTLWPDAKRAGHLQRYKPWEAPDVMGTPFWIECKAHGKVNVSSAFEKALEDLKTHCDKYGSRDGYIYDKALVIVVYKHDRFPDMVSFWSNIFGCLVHMDFKDWIRHHGQ